MNIGRKMVVFMAVLFFGGFIALTVDDLLGVSFQDVGEVVAAIHKAIYLLWGAAITVAWMWFVRKEKP